MHRRDVFKLLSMPGPAALSALPCRWQSASSSSTHTLQPASHARLSATPRRASAPASNRALHWRQPSVPLPDASVAGGCVGRLCQGPSVPSKPGSCCFRLHLSEAAPARVDVVGPVSKRRQPLTHHLCKFHELQQRMQAVFNVCQKVVSSPRVHSKLQAREVGRRAASPMRPGHGKQVPRLPGHRQVSQQHTHANDCTAFDATRQPLPIPHRMHQG